MMQTTYLMVNTFDFPSHYYAYFDNIAAKIRIDYIRISREAGVGFLVKAKMGLRAAMQSKISQHDPD